jgi:hypothetical protein
VTAEAAPVFVAAVTQEAIGDGEANTNRKVARRRGGCQTSGTIKVEIDGVTVRVGSGADAKTVAAVRLVRVKTVRADRGAPRAPGVKADPGDCTVWLRCTERIAGCSRLGI